MTDQLDYNLGLSSVPGVWDEEVPGVVHATPYVPNLASAQELAVIAAARDPRPIDGLTHNFYRYPARFSPLLVGELIEAFTKPGDLVLDPFMGGGTTLVEAAARGRKAIGSDISTLATFVSRVKTGRLSPGGRQLVLDWLKHAPAQINMRGREPTFPLWAEAGYFRHMDSASRWRIRKALAQLVESAQSLDELEAEEFARCIILRTAQWALDGRRVLPDLLSFKRRIQSFGAAMIESADHFTRQLEDHAGSAVCLNQSIVGLDGHAIFRDWPAPRLILTSPPYPGVHVLYHRWQVDGGKETGAPFFIANALDGSGGSYYTMGDRKRPRLDTYFSQLRDGLTSLSRLSDQQTTIVQVVAFSQPDWQLQAYLDVANEVGLSELKLRALRESPDGRLWRSVPNRKWYADQKGRTAGAQEVVLFHRLK
jgi:hypothetical protein